MRVAIDATCWNNRRGFGRFTRELIQAMATTRGDRDLLLVADSATAATPGFPSNAEICAVPVSRPPIEAASAESSRTPMDLWRFYRAVARQRPDAMFFPAVYSYFPIPRAIPSVVAVHDVIAETHPSLIFASNRSRRLWNWKLRLALGRSGRIVTVSENARQRIAGTFHRPVESITIIGEGVASVLYRRSEQEQQTARRDLHLAPDEPLLLYVGGISPHKNLVRLIEALRLLVDRLPMPWRIVFAGEVKKDSFHSSYEEVRRTVDELGLQERVVFAGYVPDETLSALYSAARVVVMPSIDEGFGLPAAEAMACGTPVAASSSGALPEVVRDAGLFFDPLNPSEMADTIARLLTDDALTRRCSLVGLEYSRQYRWECVAEKVFAELDRVAAV